MTRILLPFAAVVAALSPLVDAGVKFTSPKAGDKIAAGGAVTVKWEEGGTGPKLTDLTTYELQVIVGGNDGTEQFPVGVITTSGAFTAGNTASGRIETTQSEDLKDVNAYFIKMIAVGKTGGQLLTYSDRFSFSGMTGKNVLSDAVKAAVKDIDTTTGPPTVDTTTDGTNPADADPVDDDVYKVDYAMQTGLTRYAPMQPVPPTKVTAKNTKPLYPTSSVKIAKTRLPIPSQLTTLTQSQTFSVKSMENTVAAAPHATDDMAKFLRRWQD
ncbi:hypothetical protein BKA58DRAFT_382273 [Alternaria rosae]|uniref:uncharacterized protein n=1 Tax=Alternaria rosae TaxID=1187941 RepID=UPI001E8E97F1|nr:uncharacterized protein BKA58DRAFT_382273 [Alternaria rosae]KAH6872593.1 hypothetical protein BKA58DRAFT_382273 [Alternaria rosae]